MTARARSLRTLQRALIGAVVVWVAVHTAIVWTTGMSAWRLGGLGMYAEPEVYTRASAIVACAERGCADERSDARHFAPTRDRVVPLLRPVITKDGVVAPHRYALVSIKPVRGPVNQAIRAFLRFPSSWNARAMVRTKLASPCGPYLVVHYRQHMSMLSRKAWVPIVRGRDPVERLHGGRADSGEGLAPNVTRVNQSAIVDFK